MTEPIELPKRLYNGPGIDRSLEALEQHFGMSSADFYEAYLTDDDSPALKAVSLFDRHVWADLYRESRRLNDAGH